VAVVDVFGEPHQGADVLGPEDGVELPGEPAGVQVRADGALGLSVAHDLEHLLEGLRLGLGHGIPQAHLRPRRDEFDPRGGETAQLRLH